MVLRSGAAGVSAWDETSFLAVNNCRDEAPGRAGELRVSRRPSSCSGRRTMTGTRLGKSSLPKGKPVVRGGRKAPDQRTTLVTGWSKEGDAISPRCPTFERVRCGHSRGSSRPRGAGRLSCHARYDREPRRGSPGVRGCAACCWGNAARVSEHATVVSKPGQPFVHAVPIARYTDSLPSPMALEIDVHELCHAVAAPQFITRPCHIENNGQINISGAYRNGALRSAFGR